MTLDIEVELEEKRARHWTKSRRESSELETSDKKRKVPARGRKLENGCMFIFRLTCLLVLVVVKMILVEFTIYTVS